MLKAISLPSMIHSNGVCKIEQPKPPANPTSAHSARKKQAGKVHWDDFEVVLAIAESGSLSGAARQLKVNHATVFRRLGDIERRLGVALFERSRLGYRPTQAGEEMAHTAQQIEEAVISTARRIAGRDLKPAGAVWLTTTDSLLADALSPIFADFRKHYPDITFDIFVSHQLFNLTKREADVAIRPTNNPPENLIGRRIVDVAVAVYGARQLVGTQPQPGDDLMQWPWIGPGPHLPDLPMQDWMQAQGYDVRCAYRVNSVSGMRSAVRSGSGISLLPCYLADADPELVQLSDPIADCTVGLWFLMHPDLRDVARIRTLLEFTTEALRQRSADFVGQPLNKRSLGQDPAL
jgi:DNA-binding transcriptional LysR family regulator